jgi:single-strand DNA-binding protein
MSLNLNNVVLAGHLTRDPELKQIGADRVVANTGLAINRRWKDAAGTQHEEATFVEIEAWGRTAELVGQYLKKGSPAYVEGRLKLDSWDDKESGQKRTKMKVVAENVQFLGARPTSSEGGEGDASERSQPAPAASRASAPAPKRRAVAPPVDVEPPF